MHTLVSLITMATLVVHNLLGCHGHFVCGHDHPVRLRSDVSSHVITHHCNHHQHDGHEHDADEHGHHHEHHKQHDDSSQQPVDSHGEHDDHHDAHSHLISSTTKSTIDANIAGEVIPNVWIWLRAANARPSLWTLVADHRGPPHDLPRYLTLLNLRN